MLRASSTCRRVGPPDPAPRHAAPDPLGFTGLTGLARRLRTGLLCAGLGPALAVAAGAAGAAAEPAPAPRPTGVAAAGAPAPTWPPPIGQTERLWLVWPQPGDTLRQLAERWLGDAAAAWRIAEAEPALSDWPEDAALPVDRPVVIPRQPRWPTGLRPQRFDGIAVLCWHRIDAGHSPMSVSPAQFSAQIDGLLARGWRVVPLRDVARMLAGELPVPPRAVALSFDDGWASVHTHAWPLLRDRGLPATLFVTSTLIGSRDGLSWEQLQQMQDSGLIDVQAHGRDHLSLLRPPAGARADWLDEQLRQPRRLLESRLAGGHHRVSLFAYPYGDADATVAQALRRQGYVLGATVEAGLNRFDTPSAWVRRIMVLGGHTPDDLARRLQDGRLDGGPLAPGTPTAANVAPAAPATPAAAAARPHGVR